MVLRRPLLAAVVVVAVTAGLGARGFIHGPLVAPPRRALAPPRAQFHPEGDESSTVALSGAWNLVTHIEEEDEQTMIVQLSPHGSFSTPRGADNAVSGRWSVEQTELTIAIYGIAHTVRRWYVGEIDEAGTTVKGFIGDGAIDPEWVGTFTLSLLLPPLDRKPFRAPVQRTVFEHAQFIGRWRISTNKPVAKHLPARAVYTQAELDDGTMVGADAMTVKMMEDLRRRQNKDERESAPPPPPIMVHDVELFANSTWRSTQGLAGRWNVFEDEVVLHSGIKGKGRRLWLQAVRFKTGGGRFTTGVQITQDLLFLGRISATFGLEQAITEFASPEAEEAAWTALEEAFGLDEDEDEEVEAAFALAEAEAELEARAVAEVGVESEAVAEAEAEPAAGVEAKGQEDGIYIQTKMSVSGFVAEGNGLEPNFIAEFEMEPLDG